MMSPSVCLNRTYTLTPFMCFETWRSPRFSYNWYIHCNFNFMIVTVRFVFLFSIFLLIVFSFIICMKCDSHILLILFSGSNNFEKHTQLWQIVMLICISIFIFLTNYTFSDDDDYFFLILHNTPRFKNMRCVFLPLLLIWILKPVLSIMWTDELETLFTYKNDLKILEQCGINVNGETLREV